MLVLCGVTSRILIQLLIFLLTAVQGHVVGMYLEQARAGLFTPVVDKALKRCRAQLPWWS